LGFVYSLVGHDITLETFPRGDAASEPVTQVLSADHLSALVDQTVGRVPLSSAELGPVDVVEHRDGQTKTLLQAAFCRATLPAQRVVCNHGVVDVDGSAVTFRELTYDGKALRIAQ
jgi:hypothetical protein